MSTTTSSTTSRTPRTSPTANPTPGTSAAAISDGGDLNVAILCGVLATQVTVRTLAGGAIVAQFDVRIAHADGPPSNVPVAWYDAPPTLASINEGDAVLIVGHVHRRFFRVGGSTQSRTEVVAQRVVPRRRTKTARSVLAAVVAELQP